MYPTDLIPFHALYDHKEMMRVRLDYFSKKGYISRDKQSFIDGYGKVLENALVIRNLILKYNIRRKEDTVSSLNSLLEDMKASEIELLQKIFDV